MLQAWYDLWLNSDSDSEFLPLTPREFAPEEVLEHIESLPVTHAAVQKFEELAYVLPHK